MPYDVTMINVAPNAHIVAALRREQAAARPRKGEFLACLYVEIGESPRRWCTTMRARLTLRRTGRRRPRTRTRSA